MLKPTAYDSEDVLQSALAEYPQVIAGQSTDGDGGLRPLVLVAREIGISSMSFSLDHLFPDAEDVPVRVELKRASDTRIRREVVGQMLDCAANAATPDSNLFILLRPRLSQRVGEGRSHSTKECLAADDEPPALTGPDA